MTLKKASPVAQPLQQATCQSHGCQQSVSNEWRAVAPAATCPPNSDRLQDFALGLPPAGDEYRFVRQSLTTELVRANVYRILSVMVG